jgi:hypothetical protein
VLTVDNAKAYFDPSTLFKATTKTAATMLTKLPRMKKLFAEFLGKLKNTNEGGVALLDQTLVFHGSNLGNASAHTCDNLPIILAGGGFKSGLVYGETDDFGYKATVNRVSVPNFQATLLHTLGLDHTRLTYPHGGRDETPTEATITGATVVRELLKNPSV